MTYLDAWSDLRAPKVGAELRERGFPSLVRTRELSPRAVRSALASGSLVRVRQGVVAPPPPTDATVTDRRIYEVLAASSAAALCARRLTVVSHLSAAMAYGCWVFRPARVAHLTQTVQVSAASGPVPVRRHRAPLPPEDIRLCGEVLVTSPLRTAVDVARTEPFIEALAVVDCLLALGLSKEELLDRVGRLGSAAGARRARRVCEASTARVHSVGESVVRAVGILLGLPPAETLHEIETPEGTCQVDIAWPEIKVCVEVDGALKLAKRTGESLTRAVNKVAARHARIVEQGWVILRLTWQDLLDRARLERRLVRLVRYRTV